MRKWECSICKYVHTGDEPPEKCPVCGADKSVFVEIVDKDDSQVAQEKVSPEISPELASETEQAPEHDEGGSTAPVVEQQQEEPSGLMRFLRNMVMRHHLHPISVHTPNGVLPVAVIFIFLGLFFSNLAFEKAAFFNMVFVLLTMPVVVVTGYLAWQKKYRGAKTPVFVTKIICSAIVTVLLSLMICWRLIDSTVVLSGETTAWIYFAGGCIIVIAAGIAGHLGGKLVFGSGN